MNDTYRSDLDLSSICSILIILFYVPIYSQTTDLAARFIHDLDSKTIGMASDLLYIQTSKGIYETEEDVWFKVYALDAQFLEPSNRSNTLYLELVEEGTRKVVWQEKYEIVEGVSEGHLFLDASLVPGPYLLLALTATSYTPTCGTQPAMRKLQIIDNVSSIKTADHVDSLNMGSFGLFPEGGHLVSGLHSKVAFKCTAENALPIEVVGTLFRDSVPLLDFNSSHAGMGTFDFIPDADRSYHVRIQAGLADSTFELPKVHREGAVMHLVDQTKDKITLHVSRTARFVGESMYLRLQMRGVVYGITKIGPSKITKVVVPITSMPQGIMELTLFNSQEEPIVERLVYVNHHKKLTITASLNGEVDDIQFKTRQKVLVKIKVTDDSGSPRVGHLGLSIFEKIFENSNDSKNILTHYYLSTQIRGPVYDPGFYFNDENTDRVEAMDLLLLTQGWRRHIWSEHNLPNPQTPENELLRDGIPGTVRKEARRSKDREDYPAILAYSPDEDILGSIVDVDSLGTFMVTGDHLRLGKGGYTYLRYFPQGKSKYDIILKDDSFRRIDSLVNCYELSYPIPNQLVTEDQEEILSLYAGADIVRLDEVVVSAKRKRAIRDKYIGKLDSLAKLQVNNDYVCKYNILNCQIHTTDKENRKPVEGAIYLKMLVWNGSEFVPGTDKSNGFINPPLPPYRYPSLTDEDLLEMFNILRIKGYYGEMEFYQPDHEVYHDPAIDYRNTLLWTPSLVTDQNGEAEITFYCSDIHSRFLINIEGVAGDGLLGTNHGEFLVIKI